MGNFCVIKILHQQGRRWLPAEHPDFAAVKRNVQNLTAAGIPILAGTDAPIPASFTVPACTARFSTLSMAIRQRTSGISQRLRNVWISGIAVDLALYVGSDAQRDGIASLHATTSKVIAAIRKLWPAFEAHTA